MSASVVVRPGLPATRVTFQLAGELEPAETSPETTFAAAIECVTSWVQEKFAVALPGSAKEGGSFEAELPGQQVRCIAIPDEGLWSLRLTQPDAPYPGQPAVPGRTWTTDVALRRGEGAVAVGIRVLCSSLPFAHDEVRLVRPRVVVDLASRLALREARQFELEPWRMKTPADLHELRALLVSERRSLPVYVLTQPDQRRLGLQTEEFLLDADLLARRCLGIAYVVTLPAAATFEWTNMVGKTWSVFLGAVRTYRPKLSFDNDAPTDHPLIMPERVLAFRHRELDGERGFAEFLVDQAHRHVAGMRVEWGPLLFLEDASIRQATLARQRAKDDPTRLRLSAEHVEALSAKIDRLEGDLRVAFSLAEQAEQERLRADEENRRLRGQLDVLRRAFSEKTGTSADALVELPASYDEMNAWVEEHLAGRLTLHTRALRGLKEAAFEDVALVGRALLLLADAYRGTQTGWPGADRVFEAGLKELGLRYSRSIARHRAGEEGDTYFVSYRGEEHFLEWHLRKGSGKDARRCLGIYFFWHTASEQVVVGWLTSHLDNRMT